MTKAAFDKIAEGLRALLPLRDAEVAVLTAERDRLREALQWYANPQIYQPHPHGPAFDRRDLSFCARAALGDDE